MQKYDKIICRKFPIFHGKSYFPFFMGNIKNMQNLQKKNWKLVEMQDPTAGVTILGNLSRLTRSTRRAVPLTSVTTHLESWWPDIYLHMTVKCSHIPCPFISGHMTVNGPSYAGMYSLQKYMTVYDRHMPVYTFPGFPEKYMPSCDGHMLQQSSTGYGGIWPSYDSLWWKRSIISKSFMLLWSVKDLLYWSFWILYSVHDLFWLEHAFSSCLAQFCSRWAGGGTRLARQNARLNAAHL